MIAPVFPAQSQNLPEQPVDQNGESSGDQAGKPEPSKPGFPVRILEEPEQSEDSKRQEREAEQREIEDLKAQNLAADSAKGTYQVSIAQTILAFFGTIALIYSLHLTRTATKAATIAARAALDAIAMERAWMTVGNIETARFVNGVAHGERVDNGILFMIGYSNTGRSPAVHVKLHLDYAFIKDGDNIPVFDVPTMGLDGGTVVASGRTIGDNLVINDQQTYDIANNVSRLIIFTVIQYADVFSTSTNPMTRSSMTCHEVIHRGGTRSRNGIEQDAIDFICIGPQNDAT